MIVGQLNWLSGISRPDISFRVSEISSAIKEAKVSDLLDSGSIQEAYTIWNKKVLEIRESCCKRVKIRKNWKICRLLTKAKKRITRELKSTEDREKIWELKKRRGIIY